MALLYPIQSRSEHLRYVILVHVETQVLFLYSLLKNLRAICDFWPKLYQPSALLIKSRLNPGNGPTSTVLRRTVVLSISRWICQRMK